MFVFQIEPADRSVGIMTEAFAAWDDTTEYWCEVKKLGQDFNSTEFEWFDTESNVISVSGYYAIKNRELVENLLFACIQAFYKYQD